MYRWIAILTWVALLIALPKLAYDDWKTAQASPAQSSAANTASALPAQPEHTTDPIAIRSADNLFGTVAVAPKVIEKPVEELPVTRLDLKLVGTFTHDSPKQASALIAENGKPSKRYYGGDTVAGSAELVGVTKHSVVLRRNGRDEVLRFPRISPVEQQAAPPHRRVAAANHSPAAQPSTSVQRPAAKPRPAKGTPPADNGPASTQAPSRSELKARLKRLRNRNQ